MGLFDFLFKSESAKTTKGQRPSATPSKAPSVKPTVQRPISKPETEKEPSVKFTVQQPLSKPVSEKVSAVEATAEQPKKVSIKVSNHDEIENSIQLKSESDGTTLELYCAVRPAWIFCHSVLIDKLGDLTKFIISSLYAGHSIEEISDLTHMGSTTIKEETDYLVRGGLVYEDKESLTELGSQYGRLLEIFDELSEGIGVAFNTFANLFELIEENGYYSEADPKCILPNHFIPTLARNDNYANSLDIAIEQIEEDTPFSWEIKKSLYTTVKIKKSQPGYKRMIIKDFSKGLKDKRKEEACIKVAIPCDHVLYKPRYSWVDPYRSDISSIRELSEKHDDLLSDKARLIISASQEEEDADVIAIDVDTISVELNNWWDKLEKLPKNEEIFILDRQKIMISLGSEACEGIRLEEIDRDELYKIRYFPYSRMEVQ